MKYFLTIASVLLSLALAQGQDSPPKTNHTANHSDHRIGIDFLNLLVRSMDGLDLDMYWQYNFKPSFAFKVHGGYSALKIRQSKIPNLNYVGIDGSFIKAGLQCNVTPSNRHLFVAFNGVATAYSETISTNILRGNAQYDQYWQQYTAVQTTKHIRFGGEVETGLEWVIGSKKEFALKISGRLGALSNPNRSDSFKGRELPGTPRFHHRSTLYAGIATSISVRIK